MGRLSSSVVLVILGLALTAEATNQCRHIFRPEFLFGLEFTVTNEALVTEGNKNPAGYGLQGNPLKEKAWRDLMNRIREKCQSSGRCRTERGQDKHGEALKVVFQEDGFFFTVGVDSVVLEMNAQPKTSTEFKKVAPRLEEFFLQPAAQAGLRPHIRAGGGHIHISRTAFEENALLFRNFFVDFQNRPELAFGALGNHLGNSAPLSALKPKQRQAAEKVLRDFDPQRQKIDDLVTLLHREVFTEGYFTEWGSGNYYQAFNMTRMRNGGGKATLEIRSFRPQENTDVFQLQTTLLETWINKLKNLNKPLPFLNREGHDFRPQQIVDAYADLLRQLDLPWETYKILLPPNLRQIQPSKKMAVSYRLEDFQ